MQQVHVRKTFQLVVPFRFSSTTTPSYSLRSDPDFGFVLTLAGCSADTNETFQYNLKLYSAARNEDKTVVKEEKNCLVWAGRDPFRFQTENNNSNVIESIILRVKIAHKVFDFRKVKKRSINFRVECFNADGLVGRAVSQPCQLLPKRRESKYFELKSEVYIALNWQLSTATNEDLELLSSGFPSESSSLDISPNSNSEGHLAVVASSEGEVSQDFYVEQYQSSQALAYYQMESEQYMENDNQYMVLYNGNAEVVGNFRALNFYKASDINIKEDIRLLMEDQDCRSVLLRIDGVEYKFKHGVTRDSDRRFVGYIAQQIESVVPSAVQLIDGVLHVDYESLIPYLSESIKQNYHDIQTGRTETEQIRSVVDLLYNEFINKDQKRRVHTETAKITSSRPAFPVKNKMWRWLLGVIMAVTLLIGIGVGVFFAINWQSPSPAPAPAPMSSPLPLVPIEDHSLMDRKALISLFNSTNGHAWANNFNWLSGASMCEWAGVECEHNRVTQLSLAYNNLQGTIPESFGDLDWLTDIDLSQNGLTGTIPATFAKLKRASNLFLFNNQLTGTIPFESLRSCGTIRLQNNTFSASQLPNTFQGYNWTWINLSMCNIVGTAPPALGGLNTMFIDLSRNKLSGSLPDLPFVQMLDVSANQFEGTLPRLSVATILNVAHNAFTGSFHHAFEDNQKLTAFYASDNQFSGEMYVPTARFEDSFIHLDVSHNSFSSISPSVFNATIAHFSLLECDASGNNFKCPIPDWMAELCRATCK